MKVVRLGPLRKEMSLVSFSIPPRRETKKDSIEDDSPTGNEITYEYYLVFQSMVVKNVF